MIRGLFETHLLVTDLDRSAQFYDQLPGLELACVEAKRAVRFYWIAGRGKAMLGLWEVDPSLVERRHLAFEVAPAQMGEAVAVLKELGIVVGNFHCAESDRLLVHAWMPAVSAYFSDPDGHSLEYIAMLPDPPRPELGQVPWDEWERMHNR